MNDKFIPFDSDDELQLIEDNQPHSQGATADFNKQAATEKPFSDKNRRIEARRQTKDRRKDIRFELDKDDRRSGDDQRKDTWNQKYRI